MFGGASRAPTPAERAVRKLAELGAYGVNFHDNDVFEFGAGEAERDERIAAFRKALAETGLVVTTATTNLAGPAVDFLLVSIGEAPVRRLGDSAARTEERPVVMNPNYGYQLDQAQRTKARAEIIADDARLGRQAAAASRGSRALARRARTSAIMALKAITGLAAGHTTRAPHESA